METEIQELERLAVRLHEARCTVEARRIALSRYALVWWHGAAADRYRALVDERRLALGRVADELGWLEESVLALASAARAEAAPLRGVPEAS